MMIHRLLMFSAFFSCLNATSDGFHLVAGDASRPSIDGAGNMTIKSGKNAIIHWDHFSIDQGKFIHFDQMDAQSRVLNRVIGPSGTQIHGLLKSNGSVYLINPNGVVIGPTGRIDVAGFIGSTLDLLNEDFLKANEFLFSGLSKHPVINLGTIQARNGDVFLIGARVQNSGKVEALKGHVGIGRGSEILIQPQGKNRIFIRAASDISLEEDCLLEHSGLIESLSSELQSSISPYSQAIRMSKTESTFSSIEQDGRILLCAIPNVTDNYVGYSWDNDVARFYEQSASLYPGGTYGGSSYMVFYKTPQPPSSSTPSVNPVVPVYSNQVTSATTISNILNPTTTNSSTTVMQGPATEADPSPLVQDNHSTPQNNDARGTFCP